MTQALALEEVRRYSRQLMLPEMGGAAQARLKAARVLIVGAGGLGSPVALYLAASGIGTLGLVDPDTVELSNLNRQVAHTTDRIGAAKVASAAAAISALNPLVAVETHEVRLDADNVSALARSYDLVCDCSDNFTTRCLVAEACLHERRTLVSAAVAGFEGQLATFRPGPHEPCYRCLYAEEAGDELDRTCAETGVLGSVTGVMGTLQATEVVKELTGIGETMAGRLLVWNALSGQFRTMRLPKDPDCPLCSKEALLF